MYSFFHKLKDMLSDKTFEKLNLIKFLCKALVSSDIFILIFSLISVIMSQLLALSLSLIHI